MPPCPSHVLLFLLVTDGLAGRLAQPHPVLSRGRPTLLPATTIAPAEPTTTSISLGQRTAGVSSSVHARKERCGHGKIRPAFGPRSPAGGADHHHSARDSTRSTRRRRGAWHAAARVSQLRQLPWCHLRAALTPVPGRLRSRSLAGLAGPGQVTRAANPGPRVCGEDGPGDRGCRRHRPFRAITSLV